jgi:hypothetical protein
VSGEPKSPEGPSAVAGLFSVMLMVVGVLFMSLGGLCSLGVVGLTILDIAGGHGGWSALKDSLEVLVYGGLLPLGIGFGLFVFGRRLGRKPPPDPGATFD